MAIVIGYHTLEDRGNPQQILESGPKQCFNKSAWLGYGYYFWDTEIKWAHSWLKGDYMIFKANIEINEKTFDLLGNVQHTIDFGKHYKDLNQILKRLNKPNATVAQVIDYMKRKTDFSKNYNSIRAYDEPKNEQYYYRTNSRESFYLNKRVQICLIDKTNLSLQTFSIEYPEKYK